MKNLILAFTMLFTLAACSADEPAATPPAEQGAEPTATEQPAEQPTVTTELTVWGMVCSRCENKVINAVSALYGVMEVSADSNADTVTVVHEPELDAAFIEEAITAEGFNLP